MSCVQAALVAAIVGDKSASQQLASSVTGSLAGERLIQIYRHNFISRFVEALQVTFPKTQQMLGQECFQGLAQAFIQQEAFVEASLLHFGDTFAGFLAQQEVLAEHAYCVDLARLEWAMEVAYNQANGRPVGRRSPSLRDGLQVIPSAYALFDIWRFDGDRELDVRARSQWIIVYRDGLEVMLSCIAQEQGVYVQSLIAADDQVQQEVLDSLNVEQLQALQKIGVLT
jgi:hypothetical protein